MFTEKGERVFLKTYLDSGRRNVVILFNTSCSRCLGEAVVWQRLAASRSDYSFLGIMGNPTLKDLDSFRESGLAFPVYRGDPDAYKILKASISPVIHIVNGTGLVLAVFAGELATDSLAQFVAR